MKNSKTKNAVNTAINLILHSHLAKILMFCLFLFAGYTSAFAQFSGGSGTAADPYQIANISDWNKFANGYLSGVFILTADIGVPNDTSTWVTSARTSFESSVFDGNNHTVWVNMRAGGGDAYCGLFNSTFGDATIRNVTAKGRIRANNSQRCGGIIGLAENCV